MGYFNLRIAKKINFKQYVLFVIENTCNSRCSFCNVGGGDGKLTDLLPVSLPFLKKFLKVIDPSQYPGIIFSGGEPTLNDQLPDYVSYARKKGFSHIMVQTNGRTLSDIHMAEKLKAAGVDQLFFSFHSATKELADKMAGHRGAYEQTVKALKNLEKLEMPVITNTLITAINFKELPRIGNFLKAFGNIPEMHLWGYTPMSAKAGEWMPPYAKAAPYLNKTIGNMLSAGRKICVKWYPVCLLDFEYRKFQTKDLPYCLGVKKAFDERGGRCGYKPCPSCEWTQCWGIPALYKQIMPPGSWMPALKD